ncbi:MAG: hypothetical protein KTR13_09235 [Saprospiraceae bacterium]|nr:hypothetical protein [Saprospiraceae bacterium]
MPDKEIEIIIQPISDQFDATDSRWSQQKNVLLKNLQGEASKVEKRVEAVEGMKGGLETLVVTLGPVVINSVVEVFKAWIGRDKTKKIEIKANVGGKEVSFSADATGVDKETLKEFLHSAVEKAG